MLITIDVFQFKTYLIFLQPMRNLVLVVCMFFFANTVFAQKTSLVGYVYEGNNRGLIKEYEVELYRNGSKLSVTLSDEQGKFEFELPTGDNYTVKGKKEGFYAFEQTIQTTTGNINYIKIPVKRLPGYDFEVLISEKPDTILRKAEAVENTEVLILNNTQKYVEKTLHNQASGFKFKMYSGNHYTFLIQKDGFYTKRVEVNVNVNGCILCFTGLNLPQVANTMTDNNMAGTVSASVYLERIVTDGTTTKIPNIIFDKTTNQLSNASKIEADKFATFLKDNANLNMQLTYKNVALYPSDVVNERIQLFKKYLIGKGIDGDKITTSIWQPNKITRGSNSVEYNVSGLNNNVRVLLPNDYKSEKEEKIIAQQDVKTSTAITHVETKKENEDTYIEIKEPIEIAKPITYSADSKKETTTTEVEKVLSEKSSIITDTKIIRKDSIQPAVATTKNTPTLTEQTITKEEQKQEVVLLNTQKEKVIETPLSQPKTTLKADISTPKNEVKAESKTERNIKYKIEVLQLHIFLPASATVYKENSDVVAEKQKNGKIAYLTKSYYTEQEATERMNELKKMGYSESKIVQYINGERQ